MPSPGPTNYRHVFAVGAALLVGSLTGGIVCQLVFGNREGRRLIEAWFIENAPEPIHFFAVKLLQAAIIMVIAGVLVAIACVAFPSQSQAAEYEVASGEN